MVIAMNLNCHPYIACSLVSLCILCKIEVYETAPASHYVGDPQGFRPRVVRSPTAVRKHSAAFSKLDSPFSSTRAARHLSFIAENYPPATLPHDGEKLEVADAGTPLPLPGFASLQDVSVTCSNTEFTVRVKKSFYGFTTTAAELTLGKSCKSNGVDKSSGDLLFTYPLISCDVKPEVQPDHVLFKTVLHYVPLTTHSPILRARCIDVDIQCHFKSYHHVYQLAVHPTWATPTRKILRWQVPSYGIRTMNAAWTAPTPSNIFVLGQRVNFQVFAYHLQVGEKLFIDHCYASMSEDPAVTPKYSFIENFGCMVDSKMDVSSAEFVAPRTDEAINFVLDAFHFAQEPTAKVFLHCKLFVMDGDPSPNAKSCTYSKEDRKWKALSGKDSMCDCCDSKCLTPKARQSMYEGLQTNGPMTFTSQFLKAKANTPLVNLAKKNLLWFEAEMDRQTEQFNSYQDPVWQEDYELKYNDNSYKDKGGHTHLPDRESGEEELKSHETVSNNQKEGIGEGEGSVFGDWEETGGDTWFGEREETLEEDHLHYGLFSGIGETEFIDYDWLAGAHWGG